MSFIRSEDGTQLYVKQWGQGRPVVLIHGWPLSADSWDDQAEALAEAGFQVIAYDRRGFGRSDQPSDGYDYDTLAADLAAVLRHTDATNATLVGFSMGGGEVARYLSRYAGQNVSQAVLVASVVPYMLQTEDNPDGTPQAVFDEMSAGIKNDRAHFFAGFFKDFYGVSLMSHPVSAEVLTWSQQMAMQAGLRPTLACAKAFASTDFRADLAHFNVPTLIIHGDADKTVPIDTSARAAAKAIPHAQLIEYAGAPHGLTASHKQRLTQDLIEFCRYGVVQGNISA